VTERPRIELHPEAVDEARATREWYAARDERAATWFLQELEDAIARIAEAPQRWRLFRDGTRRYPLRRFPFLVVYLVSADVVQVVAVAHGRRRPGYWKGRVANRPE
jgi:plasmid stabilization system protein ParE